MKKPEQKTVGSLNSKHHCCEVDKIITMMMMMEFYLSNSSILDQNHFDSFFLLYG